MFNTNSFPAVFNPKQDDELSAKYQFVNTAEVIQALNENGFNVRQASQRGRGAEAKHMVRLTHPDIDVGIGNKLEVVLRNSHDGTSSLNLQFGVFRLVCTNGLVVCDNMIQALRLRHMGSGVKTAVQDALMQINDQRALVAQQIAQMQQTELNKDNVNFFAWKALVLAFPDEIERHTQDNAKLISMPRRAEDKQQTVWNVYNAIQENIIRGGFKLEGMNRTLRTIRDLDRDFKINKGLWTLAVDISSKKAA